MGTAIPNRIFCPNCGKEIPAGSRFCASCGTPVQGMGGGAGQGLPEPPKPGKDKGKTALIVGIAAVAVLIIALIIAIAFLIGSRKKDSWEAEERESRYEEEERDREEEEEAAEPEEEEIPEEAPAEEAPVAEEPEPEAPAPAAEEHTGNYAEVDFGRISYRPENQPYDLLTTEELQALNDEINFVDVPNSVVNGTIYSIGDDKELDVRVYGDINGSGLTQIGIYEKLEDGMYFWVYIYKDGEFAECTRLREDSYGNSLEHTIYMYSENCMVYYGEVVNDEWLYRMDLGSQSTAAKSQFMENEAEYYNRGRLIYDIVSEWE